MELEAGAFTRGKGMCLLCGARGRGQSVTHSEGLSPGPDVRSYSGTHGPLLCSACGALIQPPRGVLITEITVRAQLYTSTIRASFKKKQRESEPQHFIFASKDGRQTEFTYCDQYCPSPSSEGQRSESWSPSPTTSQKYILAIRASFITKM